MNLFVVGIRLGRDRSRLLRSALADVASRFPMLAELEPHHWSSESGDIAVGSYVPEANWSGPRRYVADTVETLTNTGRLLRKISTDSTVASGLTKQDRSCHCSSIILVRTRYFTGMMVIHG